MTLEELVAAAGIEGEWEIGDEGESFSVNASVSDERRQRVSVRRARAGDGKWLRLFSRIGPAERLGPGQHRRVLAVNFELLGGCLALHGDDLVVTQTLLADATTATELLETIGAVARLADHYEQMIFSADEA